MTIDDNRKPAVLQVCEGLGPLHGGPGVDLPNYCRALARIGCRVHLVTTYASNAEYHAARTETCALTDGFSLSSFPCANTHSRWRLSPAVAQWLFQNIGKFDIIHLNSLYSFPILLGAAAARLCRIPYVLTPHGSLARIQRKVNARKKAVYHALVANRILDHAGAIIYSAVQEWQDAMDMGIRAPAALIHNGVELKSFEQLPARGQFRAKFFAGTKDPMILYLGRLNAKKGLDVLIEAFAQLAKCCAGARLALVGQGDPPSYAEAVRAWIDQRNLTNRVVMPGMLDGNDKLAALADADVFVLPSRGENFASAMFEAMACKVPVVISEEVAAAPEVQGHNAGISVKLAPADVRRGLVRLLEDAALRREMGENARSLAGQYTSDRSASELVTLYRNVIESRPRELWAFKLPSQLAIQRAGCGEIHLESGRRADARGVAAGGREPG